ncbi:MAG: PaeR7I family type II restriction endonuclease [Planctomycetota bacterium]
MAINPEKLKVSLRQAIALFWETRERQSTAQRHRGSRDQGRRAAVTGGAQMNGFINLIGEIVRDAGIPDAAIYTKQRLELPGYYRATKNWDMLVVVDGTLLVVIEAKSQVGSFGNNFNNRTEEAIGSAVDLWTAFREGALSNSSRPWLGYLFLLEDSEKSRKPVSVREPHFCVFEEFRDASYCQRYEILLRKLVRERHYEAAAFLTSNARSGLRGEFLEPAIDLSFKNFATSLTAHASAFADMR